MKKKIFVCIILYVFLFNNLFCYADESPVTYNSWQQSLRDYVFDVCRSFTFENYSGDPNNKVELSGITNMSKTSGDVMKATPSAFCNFIYNGVFQQPLTPSLNYVSGTASAKERKTISKTDTRPIFGNTDSGVITTPRISSWVFTYQNTCSVPSSPDKNGYYGTGRSRTPIEDKKIALQVIGEWLDNNTKTGDLIECCHNVGVYIGNVKLYDDNGNFIKEVRHVIANVQWKPNRSGSGIHKTFSGLFSLTEDLTNDATQKGRKR